MNITVKKINFPQQEASSPINMDEIPVANHRFDLLKDMEVPCQVRLGSFTLTIAELQRLHTGQTLTLDQNLHEPLDILVNQQLIARGELMSHEDCFAIRITEMSR